MSHDDDFVEVHFVPKSGSLSLECGHDSFVRIRDSVRAEVALSETEEIPTDAITEIEIIDATHFRNSASGFSNHLAFIGCAIAELLLSVVFVAGIMQIAAWIQT